MIKFDPSKQKKLSFNVSVQGIDPSLLEYNLRISDGQIDYGFKGENENGTISFTVPALSEVVNRNILNNLSEIKIEVHDKNNKYYLKPFHDEVRIKEDVKVEASLGEESEENKDSEFSVSATLSEHSDSEEVEDTKQPVTEKKKKTKFGEFLKG